MNQPQDGQGGRNQRRRRNQNNNNNNGRVYALAQPPEIPDHSVIRGIIRIYGSFAKVLIDTGASHSFISYQLARSLRLRIEPLVHPLTVATPISGVATLKDVCRSCVLDIGGCTVEFDLIILDMTEFDVIVGMDWLSAFRARVDCHRRRVTFRTPEGERFFFVGEGRFHLNPLPMRRMLANIWAEETDMKAVELPQ